MQSLKEKNKGQKNLLKMLLPFNKPGNRRKSRTLSDDVKYLRRTIGRKRV